MKGLFKDKVYQLTRLIPKGKVATYGQIARLAGNKKAARAIGFFMRINPDAPHTPCHRVVSSSGDLTGYSAAGGLAKKRKMLLNERVIFSGKKVNLAVSQWEGNI